MQVHHYAAMRLEYYCSAEIIQAQLRATCIGGHVRSN